MEGFQKKDAEVVEAFFASETIEDVANALEIKLETLMGCLFYQPEDKRYVEFEIPKRGSDYRLIKAPYPALKMVQGRLAQVLSAAWEPTVCSYGFLPGKNIVDNAKLHVGKSLILNVDLKDFFPSINFGRVRSLFLAEPYGMTAEAATTIAKIACHKNELPQGAPSSPVISNMISKTLDRKLLSLAKKCKCHYTRYADDITFSTHQKRFPKAIVRKENGTVVLGEELLEVIETQGFTVNPEKITLSARSSHQEVTGIVVNEKPNIRRQYVQQLRCILHNCKRDGVYEQALAYIDRYAYKIPSRIKNSVDQSEIVEKWFSNVIEGKIEFVRMVKGPESPAFFSLANAYNSAIDIRFRDIPAQESREETLLRSVFVIEVGEINMQGTCFYVGQDLWVTSAHVFTNADKQRSENYKITDTRTGQSYEGTLRHISDDVDYAILYCPCNAKDITPLRMKEEEFRHGRKLVFAGFPQYTPGSRINVQDGDLIGSKIRVGVEVWETNARIIVGASGGPVLNQGGDAVGIIKLGSTTPREGDRDCDQQHGFIPIGRIRKYVDKDQFY